MKEGLAAKATSSLWHFLIVPSPQKRRSNASCAEITRTEQSETEKRWKESGSRGNRRKTIKGSSAEIRRGVSVEEGRNRFVMVRVTASPLPPHPLQLFARATLIKQDNLLSNRALPDMASAVTGQNCRSRVHILMIHIRPRFRSLAGNIISRILKEGKRICN